MSFDRRYALLGRVFLGAVGVCVVSIIIMFGIRLYGDQAQALEILQSYRRYSIAVIISLWYAISSRGLGGVHTTILTILLGGHIFVMMSYILLVVTSVPFVIYGIIMGLLVIGLITARSRFRGLRVIAILSGVLAIVLFGVSLIPLYPHQISISSRFSIPKLHLTIQYRDSEETLRNTQAQIRIYSGADMRTIELSDQNIKTIDIISGNTIVYASNAATLQSRITIHARDGSLLSLTPQTSVTIGDTTISTSLSQLQTHHTLNQGTIVFSQHLLYDRPDGWGIWLNNRRTVSCSNGTMSTSSSRTQMLCNSPRNDSISIQTGVGSGGIIQQKFITYSGNIVYQQSTTGRNSVSNQTGINTFARNNSGYDAIRNYHQTAKQEYHDAFEQRLTQKTSRWLSHSKPGETIVLYKTSLVARLRPEMYSKIYTDYNTYLFIKGDYQGGPLDTEQISWLALMRKR